MGCGQLQSKGWTGRWAQRRGGRLMSEETSVVATTEARLVDPVQTEALANHVELATPTAEQIEAANRLFVQQREADLAARHGRDVDRHGRSARTGGGHLARGRRAGRGPTGRGARQTGPAGLTRRIAFPWNGARKDRKGQNKAGMPIKGPADTVLPSASTKFTGLGGERGQCYWCPDQARRTSKKTPGWVGVKWQTYRT